MRTYDFVAIGGGNTGLGSAHRIAAAGHKVALVDRGAIGGLCSLNGCNPKKVLVRSSEVIEEIRHAAKFGIDVTGYRVDWSRVIDRKETFTTPVTQQSLDGLREQKIDFIAGAPRFVSPTALEVNGERIEFEHCAIATGSTPRKLEFPGAEFTKTSDDILALRTVPESLVIIGAGVVAFEFGHVFARLGSKVTMLVHEDHALSGNEEGLVDALVEYSRTLGIRFEFQAAVQQITKDGKQFMVDVATGNGTLSFSADFVLNAAGRVPSLGGLDLEAAGVEYDGRGVRTNDFLRTSNPRVFAGGDAHGRMQLSPVASYEGQVIARNLLERDAQKVCYDFIPRAIYTVPTFASVGITETEARRRGIEINIVSNDMSGWKVYGILGAELARATVIEEKRSGRILGAHLLHAAAGEQIHVFALAMAHGIKADSLREFVYAYPTPASALAYAV
jgi:glutathione reductase (NADPH)